MKPKNNFVTPEINLLPEDNLEQKPGGKFLKWSLSWGKKIVIVTELVVVLAFLSRFKLDSDVANLSEEIDKRKIIIEASQDFESEFRTTQEKINQLKAISSVPSVLTIYDTASSLIPSGITLSSINVKDNNVSLSGTGQDPEIATMVAAFKSSPQFGGDVNLEKVSKQGDQTEIEFSMTTTYTKAK